MRTPAPRAAPPGPGGRSQAIRALMLSKAHVGTDVSAVETAGEATPADKPTLRRGGPSR